MTQDQRERLTPEREAEIEARLAAVTPGKWEVCDYVPSARFLAIPHMWGVGFGNNGRDGGRFGLIATCGPAGDTATAHDACFIADAPADMAALLAEVRALRAEAAEQGGDVATAVREYGVAVAALEAARVREVMGLGSYSSRQASTLTAAVDAASARVLAALAALAAQARAAEACARAECDGWKHAGGLNQDLTYAAEARDAWRDYAEHAAHCVECGMTSWENCHEGRELRTAAEQADKLIDPGHGRESSRLREARANTVAALRARAEALGAALDGLLSACHDVPVWPDSMGPATTAAHSALIAARAAEPAGGAHA